MPYTAEKPITPPSPDELRRRIPGWGSDLDPADRPAVPKMRLDPGAAGSHWDVPESQTIGAEGRERSIEHAALTPVFGTSQPLRGVSGAVRRTAYARFSEGRAAHWLLLLLGDRIDAAGQHVRSLVTVHPDVPATGIRSELTHHGVSSRLGRNRADVKHQWLDPLIVAGPWIAAGVAGMKLVRRMAR